MTGINSISGRKKTLQKNSDGPKNIRAALLSLVAISETNKTS